MGEWASSRETSKHSPVTCHLSHHSNLLQKNPDQPRFQCNCKNQSKQGTPKVGIVSDVVAAVFGHVIFIGDIEDTKNRSRDRDRDQKEVDFSGRIEDDACKHHCRNSSGGSDCIVEYIIFVLAIGGNDGEYEPANVKKDVI